MTQRRLLQYAGVIVCGAAFCAVSGVVSNTAAPEAVCLRQLDAESLSIETILAITTGRAPQALTNAAPAAMTNAPRTAAVVSNTSASAATAPVPRRPRGAAHRLIDLDGDGVADNREL